MSLQELPAISDLRIDNSPQKQISDLPDELLINVLSMVPQEYRSKIRQVSRKWKEISSDLGYHLDPLFMDCDNDFLPCYSARIPIRLNPTLTDTYGGMVKRFLHVKVNPRGFSDVILLQRRSEFITSPPVRVVSLLVEVHDTATHDPQAMYHSFSATLRTATPLSKLPTGVRIDDVLEGLSKMVAGVRPHETLVYGYIEFIYPTIKCSETAVPVLQAKGQSGFEIRQTISWR
jgi:hypothetical protein